MGLFSFLKKKSDALPAQADARPRPGARTSPAGSPHGPATIAGNPTTRMPLDTEAERERQREIARATAAKIDEIELEMASDIFDDEAWGSPRRAPAAVAALAAGAGTSGTAAAGTSGAGTTVLEDGGAGLHTDGLPGPESALEAAAPSSAPAVEEAAILYANGQLEAAEQSLRASLDDNRSDRMPWWMLFDLYQAGAREDAFDSIAIDYASHFETSPPAYRAPVAASGTGAGPGAGQAFSGITPTASLNGCLDASAGARLARLQALPLSAAAGVSAASTASAATAATLAPVRLEFSAVSSATPEGCAVLLDTLQALRRAGRELVLAGADHLVAVLRPMLAIGEGAAGQAPWLLLLELLLLMNREKDFEETAMDYCVTFEVSPPSFEAPARTALSISADNGNGKHAGHVPGSGAGIEGDRFLLPAVIEGDSAALLAAIHAYAHERRLLVLDCSRLARIDYGAAALLVTRLRALAARDSGDDSDSGRIIELRDLNHLAAALLRLLGAAEPVRLYTHRY